MKRPELKDYHTQEEYHKDLEQYASHLEEALFKELKEAFFAGYAKGQEDEKQNKEDFIKRLKESGIPNIELPTKDVN